MGRSDTLGFKIRLIHNQIHKTMEAKRRENEGDLTGMQRWAIGYMNDHEEQDLYQRDIEAEFSISRATASNMLQLMERKGLIRRIPVVHDARLKKLVLTEKAKDMLEKARQDMQEMENVLKSGMNEEEVAVLSGYLDRMLENLGFAKGDLHDGCYRKNFPCKKMRR